MRRGFRDGHANGRQHQPGRPRVASALLKPVRPYRTLYLLRPQGPGVATAVHAATPAAPRQAGPGLRAGKLRHTIRG